MKKLYAYTCGEIEAVELLKKVEYVYSLVNEDYELFKIYYKELCNNVRLANDIEDVLGLAIGVDSETSKKKLGVFVFDIKATNENFFKMKMDEEGAYIVLEVKDEYNN